MQQTIQRQTIGLVLTAIPGYSETFFRNKIKGLQEKGFEVLLFVDSQNNSIDFPCTVVVAPNFNGSLIKRATLVAITILKLLLLTPKRGLKLYRLDKADGLTTKRALIHLILNQFFLGHRLDWLHFGFGMLAHRRENVAKAMQAKMAVSFRGFDLYLSPLKHPGCYNLLFKKDVRYHVLSQGMKHTLMGHSIPENRIHVISPAIDTNFFQTDKKFEEADCINILTIARLHWKKGLEYTLDALAILKRQGIQFNYTVIGEGNQYERLIFAAHQLGISEHVHFVGKQSPKEVRRQLEEATIYLQYSIQEGFCNAVLEAQSMGLLCIVSDAEGLDENVIDTRTGWVVSKRHPEALAQKVIEVIRLSKEKKERIRTNAVARVKEEFNLELQNLAFYQFYQ